MTDYNLLGSEYLDILAERVIKKFQEIIGDAEVVAKKLKEQELRGIVRANNDFEITHNRVFEKIEETVPEEMKVEKVELYTKCEAFMIKPFAGWTTKKDGKNILIVNDSLWRQPKRLENVLAHEYGHILFDGAIRKRAGNYYGFRSKMFGDKGELGEGFAFWFGNSISEFKVDVNKLAQGYSDYGHNPKRIIDFFTELERREEKVGVKQTIRETPEIISLDNYV